MTVTATENGNWIVMSPKWTTNQVTMPDRGAVTLVHGGHPVAEPVDASNSVVGNAAGGGAQLVFDYDAARDHLIVGRPLDNIVTIVDGDVVFSGHFE